MKHKIGENVWRVDRKIDGREYADDIVRDTIIGENPSNKDEWIFPKNISVSKKEVYNSREEAINAGWHKGKRPNNEKNIRSYW